mgnify:CR=1 FL=1
MIKGKRELHAIAETGFAEDVVQVHLNRALTDAEDQGDFAAASEYFSQAADLDPSFSEAGARAVVGLYHQPEFLHMMRAVRIDIPLSPRMMIAGTILRMVHRREIVSLDMVEGGDAEAQGDGDQREVLQQVAAHELVLVEQVDRLAGDHRGHRAVGRVNRHALADQLLRAGDSAT